MDQLDAIRFMSHVNVPVNGSGCWNWTGSAPHSYGSYSIKHKSYQANRISYLIHRGEIPEGMKVLHSCDNPRCVNPAHLFLGTDADNVADKVAKNRQAKGSQHGMSKTTPAVVYSIRTLYKAGKSQGFIASLVGLTQAAVSLIVIGKKWAHVHQDLISPKQKRFGRG